MFEEALKSKLKAIFGVKKVTLSAPGESLEQECIFVEIEEARQRIREGEEIARVEGTIRMFGNADRMPFGFFSKKIQGADPDLTKDFFFYDLEGNRLFIQNIVERSASFIYFYSGQYDPDQGTLNQITFSEVEP